MTMFSNISRYPPATSTIRERFADLAALLGHLVSRLVAAAIARHQRQAALNALRQFSDRELKDIGIQRSEIEHGLEQAAKARPRMQRSGRY